MTTANFDRKSMKVIGKGERSTVYAHPTDAQKVIKVTKSAEEIEILNMMLNDPKPYFVKVYSIETKGQYAYAVIEKLPDVEEVKFQTNDGKLFFENAYMLVCDGLEYAFRHYDATQREINVANYIEQQISRLNADESIVREYYALLTQAHKDGLWIPDVAWNLGRRADGTLCCYDASMIRNR